MVDRIKVVDTLFCFYIIMYDMTIDLTKYQEGGILIVP